MPRRRTRAERQTRACRHCREDFDARSNQHYCSLRCRHAAWRKAGRERLEALIDTKLETAKREWTEEAVRRLRGEESA